MRMHHGLRNLSSGGTWNKSLKRNGVWRHGFIQGGGRRCQGGSMLQSRSGRRRCTCCFRVRTKQFLHAGQVCSTCRRHSRRRGLAHQSPLLRNQGFDCVKCPPTQQYTMITNQGTTSPRSGPSNLGARQNSWPAHAHHIDEYRWPCSTHMYASCAKKGDCLPPSISGFPSTISFLARFPMAGEVITQGVALQPNCWPSLRSQQQVVCDF